MCVKWLACCLVLFLTACQGGPLARPFPSPTQFPEEYSASVDIGAIELPLECKGKGEPTIILESDLDTFSWVGNALDRFSAISRTCRYRRYAVEKPGEEGAIPGLRTFADQAEDLHKLLTVAGVPGPYILVGHGFASAILILYANRYPGDVVGLVCVACNTNNFPPMDEFAKLATTSEEKDQLDFYRRLQSDEDKGHWMNYSERIDYPAGIRQVDAVKSLGKIPYILLMPPNSEPENKFWSLNNSAWVEGAYELAALSTHSRVELVEDTDGLTIIYNEAVDSAVREIYAAAVQE